MRSLFITGTDTEVGKSAITACLAAAFHGTARAVKPVASGVASGAGEDATLLGFGAGHQPAVFETFREPLSPHRAAALENRTIDRAALFAWLREQRGTPLLVEGVGGWTVPLSLEPHWGVPEIATALGLDVLVVAADRLGVLNHTMLTCAAVRSSGCRVVGVVLNRGVPGDSSSAHNLVDLRALLDVPVVTAPRVDLTDLSAMAAVGQAIWRDLA